MPNCPTCGDVFKDNHALKTHHGMKHGFQPREDGEYACPSCHKSFDTQQGKRHHHNSVHGESLVHEKTECEVCGSSFKYHIERSEGRFCSHECFQDWRTEYMSGQDSPLYKRVNVLCSECGVELKREPSVVQNREEHYCSRECYYRNYTAENAPGWKGGNPSYYGPSWDTQREKAVERDGYQCQECGMEREKHREKWGSDLEVHHIEPLRKFNDTKKANQLENLITVCKICHLTMEHSTQNGSTISIHSD